MKISVVTVALNSERTIGRTIESFLAQTYPDKELLVVDGVSRDATVKVVESFGAPQIRVVSEKDKGIYDAMNKGLRLFEGDAVGFLNSDDRFHAPDALGHIAEGLRDNDIVYGDIRMIANDERERAVRLWRPGSYSSRSFRLGWIVPHPTFYARRHVVDAVGGFDLRYKIASDYDFMLRAMTLRGARCGYAPQYLVDFQMGGASTGSRRNIVKGNFECLDSRRRHLGALPVDLAFFIRPLRRLFQFTSA